MPWARPPAQSAHSCQGGWRCCHRLVLQSLKPAEWLQGRQRCLYRVRGWLRGRGQSLLRLGFGVKGTWGWRGREHGSIGWLGGTSLYLSCIFSRMGTIMSNFGRLAGSSFMQIFISLQMCGEMPGGMVGRSPSSATWKQSRAEQDQKFRLSTAFDSCAGTSGQSAARLASVGPCLLICAGGCRPSCALADLVWTGAI